MSEIGLLPLVNLVVRVMARGESGLRLIVKLLICCQEGVRRFDEFRSAGHAMGVLSIRAAKELMLFWLCLHVLPS